VKGTGKSVSNKVAAFSSLWRNLRCRTGLFFACAGILFFFLGGKDLLKDPTDQFALSTIYIGCLFLVPGAVLALVTWRRELMALGLTSAATAIRGHVVSVKKDWLSQGYVLRYSFNDPMGGTYRGGKILSQQEAFTWREREEGVVRYDPNEPGISVWIARAVEFDAVDSSATAPASFPWACAGPTCLALGDDDS
jgi:hypothetical protein